MPDSKENVHWTDGYEVWSDDASCEGCDETFNDHGALEEVMSHIEDHIKATGHEVRYEVTLSRTFSKEALP